jgi:hypothetical protein
MSVPSKNYLDALKCLAIVAKQLESSFGYTRVNCDKRLGPAMSLSKDDVVIRIEVYNRKMF